MNDEEWKSIIGYEDRYMVSNHGRVKSLGRAVCNKVGCRILKEVIMKNVQNYNGYMYVFLKRNLERKKFYIHRLVACAFLDKPYDEADEVNHKNKDRGDNTYSNLEWLNHTDNCTHRDTYKKI